ncbi:MAG TPA: phosphatase PAP2 family protein, partial [Gemmatimonadaceae bacterium]
MQLTNSAGASINKFRGSLIGPTTTRGRAGVQPLASSSAVAAVAFVLLAVAVKRGTARDIDRRARRIIGPRRSKKITTAARLASNLASPHVHPLVAAGLALATYRRCGRNALAIPLASLGATVVDHGVRYIIHQSRPPKATRHPGLDKFAFPSGHTCAATAISLAFAAQGPGNTRAQNRLAASAALAASLGIAWTRLYLDEHWIDDILGG